MVKAVGRAKKSRGPWELFPKGGWGGLTWSLGSLLGGGVLAFGLDSGRVQHPRRGAVLAKVVLQAFDGAVKLVGADLEIHVHKIYGKRVRLGKNNASIIYIFQRTLFGTDAGQDL